MQRGSLNQQDKKYPIKHGQMTMRKGHWHTKKCKPHYNYIQLLTYKVVPREDQGLEKGFLSLILPESINQYMFLMDKVIFY